MKEKNELSLEDALRERIQSQEKLIDVSLELINLLRIQNKEQREKLKNASNTNEAQLKIIKMADK